MKKIFAAICILFSAFTIFAADAGAPAIIPLPQKMELREGAFKLSPDTKIFVNFGSLQTAKQLAARLRKSTGYPFKIHRKFFSGAPVANSILLTTKNAGTNLGAEGYELIVATNSIVVRAPTQAGLFYGAQTLLQLLPPEIFSTNLVGRVSPSAPDEAIQSGAHGVTRPTWQMPCVQIEDWPRFKWRGLMLDVSRHFYSKTEVEKILDDMALYKLNTLHWHLTDDQSWRIEIKKYPRLTQIGAWRNQWNVVRPSETNAHPAWAAAPASAFGADGRYGGFYTPDDIREVVKYAAARHITIVPEIEMPGHSVAALAAYPQFSCFGGPYSTDVGSGVKEGIYNPANDATFKFLDDVLTEVFQLFPGKYIHIGGDEVRKDYWKRSPECQALMKREGLKNEEELQSWFIRRMEKFVNAHGKTMIGWSEILQGGLATNAVVMDWIGGGKQAAEAGHDVIMTPSAYCYFDFYQSSNYLAEPNAATWGGPLTIRKVYSFEPIPANLPPQFQSHILGAQGNVWTERIASPQHLEYMIFPRECALAEVVWSSKDSRDWDNFQQRLKIDEQRLDELGVNYRRENGAK